MYRFMPGLKRLHLRMRQAGTERARFSIRCNHIHFDCLFLTDRTPYELVLAAVGHTGTVFAFDVEPGYVIRDIFENALYVRLADLLRTGVRTGNVLVPSDFLGQIDAAIPDEAGRIAKVTTADVLRIYQQLIEEDKKVYFKGWHRHRKKHVTGRNLSKTRICCGQKIHDICERHNISSCWSDNASDEVPFRNPPLPSDPSRNATTPAATRSSRPHLDGKSRTRRSSDQLRKQWQGEIAGTRPSVAEEQ